MWPGHTIVGEAFRDSLSSGMSMGYSDTHAAGLSLRRCPTSPPVELAGQILGDATEALDLLDDKLMGADIMVISCARLIRIDFSAAGTLLNWVTSAAGRGAPGAVRRRAPAGGGFLQRHRHQRACAGDGAHRLKRFAAARSGLAIRAPRIPN